jgi:hypothetical protein
LRPPPLDLTLDRVQAWMQAVVEHPGSADEAVEASAARALVDPAAIDRVILPSKTLTAVERVGVYQGMYLLRMVEAMEGDYPAVAHALGAPAFANLVARYVAAHPSRSYTFNRLGARFPDFLRESGGVRRRAFLSDLARLELFVTEVFDAPRSEPWPAETIGRVPEAAWPTARLKPIAAFRLGAFAYPVNAYLQSVKDENHDHPKTGRQATWAAVWRKQDEVWRLDLTRPAFLFLRDLSRGRPFGKSVAAAARGLQGDPGPQLFRWLRNWVAEGMFETLVLL